MDSLTIAARRGYFNFALTLLFERVPWTLPNLKSFQMADQKGNGLSQPRALQEVRKNGAVRRTDFGEIIIIQNEWNHLDNEQITQKQSKFLSAH